jgi:hypothetical protein
VAARGDAPASLSAAVGFEPTRKFM